MATVPAVLVCRIEMADRQAPWSRRAALPSMPHLRPLTAVWMSRYVNV